MAKPKAPGAEGAFAQNRRRKREGGPRVARALMLLIVATLFFAGVWSTQTELSENARATGELAPAGELRRVDHFDGGEIAEIFVAVGAEVKAGDPLARIEHPDIGPQIAEIEAELAALGAEIASTKWLLGDKPGHDASPAARARRASFTSQQHILQRRIDYLKEAADVAGRLRANTERRIILSEQSLARLETLRRRGVVSEAAYIIQAEDTARIHTDLLEAEASHMKAVSDVNEATAARDEARLVFREEHLGALYELEKTRRLAQLRLADLRATEGRQTVRSPETGTIQSVGITTLGEVVPPGALLFELLPSDERLVAIIKINPKDIGFIEVGSAVVLKPGGLDPKRDGDVKGVVSVISPTNIAPDREDPYFRAVVELDDQSTANGRVNKELRSGMTVQAEILTAKRTVAEYLLKPVRGFFGDALTER